MNHSPLHLVDSLMPEEVREGMQTRSKEREMAARFPIRDHETLLRRRREVFNQGANMSHTHAHRLLRDKRRNRGRIAAAFRAAASKGQFPDLGFGGYFKLADAIADAGVEAKDAELDKFLDDCCGGGSGEGFELFEQKVGAKLEGPFIDLIKELLPVLLPLLIGCL